MRPFVERNQALSTEGAGMLMPATRGRIWMRDQMFRLAPLMARLGIGSKTVSPVERAANSFTLPTY